MTMIPENQNLAIAQNFIFPAMSSNNGFTAEDFGDDFDGLKLSFQKLKIPSGGALQFEIPGDDPENPDYEKNITGIIIYNHAANAYWPLGMEYDENTPPYCSSFDGKAGHGIPGGACALCEMNRYGTDENGGKGKACKNMRTLYILRSGDAMPIQLSLPPTSLTPFSDFMNSSFVTRRRPTWSSIVEIGLKRASNGANIYSVATFKRIADLTAEQIPLIKEYAKDFCEQIKEMQQQRAVETDIRMESDGVTDAKSRYTTAEDGDHFEIADTTTLSDDSGDEKF